MLSFSFTKHQRPTWQQNSNWMTVLLAVTLLAATSQALGGQWQVLFDGTNLNSWEPSRDNKQFKLVDGVILGSSSGQTQFLHTEKEYGDFELEFEVRLHDVDLNSGVQIRTSLIRVNERGDERPSVHGPQVDIGKSPGRSGHIFNQGNGAWITPQEDLTRNELMANGQWNKLRVLAVGPRIQTWVNGKQVADAADDEAYAKYPSGVIALQVHGVKKSPEKVRHVSFRSIRVRSIESAK
jgi:hypothetical protein